MALSLDGTAGISASGNITGGNVIASGSLVVGSFAPASLSTAGNVTGGNILTGGLISSTGNIQGGNLRTVGIISATGSVTGAGITGATVSASGNVTGGNILTGGLISATGNVTTAGNVIIGSAANSQIFNSTVNLEIVNNVSTGNINFRANVNGGGDSNVFRILGTGGVALSGNLVSMNANGQVANGVSNIGSSTSTFNTIFAKATSAQYADLAEMYVSDQAYAPGTVVEFGGQYEITISSASHSTSVAGIISTNPSYLMNSAQTGEHVLPVALTGRVPCQVQGPVRKGDVLVASAIPGVAQRIGMNWQPGCILGKSMQVIDSAQIQIIEVAVGRT